MRIFTDKNAKTVHVVSLSGNDSFAGIIEATPYLVKRHRLIQGCRYMEECQGGYVHGLDELEQEIKIRGKNDDIWPPQERWVAKLVSRSVKAEQSGNCCVTARWYQEGGDPFEMLKTIVSNIDFYQYCIFVADTDKD